VVIKFRQLTDTNGARSKFQGNLQSTVSCSMKIRRPGLLEGMVSMILWGRFRKNCEAIHRLARSESADQHYELCPPTCSQAKKRVTVDKTEMGRTFVFTCCQTSLGLGTVAICNQSSHVLAETLPGTHYCSELMTF